RIGRNRIGRRSGFARMAGHMELAVMPPETKLGAVSSRSFVDGNVPVARVVTEGQHLKRIRVVLLKNPQEQPAVSGLAAEVGHLLPVEIPVGIEPMRIACRKKKMTGAVGIRQITQVLLLKNLPWRRRRRRDIEFVGGKL